MQKQKMTYPSIVLFISVLIMYDPVTKGLESFWCQSTPDEGYLTIEQ